MEKALTDHYNQQLLDESPVTGFRTVTHSRLHDRDVLSCKNHVPRASEGTTVILGDELRLKDMLAGAFEETSPVSLWRICVAVAIGISLGVLLAQYSTDGNDEWPDWIALPGDLFIDALKCLITPMVFSSIVVCIGELVEAGKAARIGSRVMLYFAMSSLVSSTIGVLFGVLFSNLFVSQLNVKVTSFPLPQFSIKCPNGNYLASSPDAYGTMALACTSKNATMDHQL
uniref:Amino acid transporter n=1 Tax=Globisporangium ultimum (strain ATCC 200006 / CBS 805.95 / DAOM BR144) TaxID=431595 RepID=K3X4X0_GLOUD